MSIGHVMKPLRVITSIEALLVFSAIIRVALILYSEWHDARSLVKYTDVDYLVFSDATSFTLTPGPLNHAQGPLGKWVNVGDPYRRETYRYTPLLAILLAPNKWLHKSFGKYLFAGCDILAGILMYKLLASAILPHTDPMALHLLNPIVIGISTRGSSESVLSLFVLLTLFCALRGWWDTAALLLGVSAHWKIYPVIYGVSCVGIIATENQRGGRKSRAAGVFPKSLNTVRFAVMSAGTFLALGACMYSIWGYPFVHETYLYHLHRRDHRHNFSPYFYQIYLTHPGIPTSAVTNPSVWKTFLRSPLTSFLTQLVLSLSSGLFFIRTRQDMIMGWFMQTATFVIFNKVCTSQYFLWYLLFIPLLSLSSPKYIICWIGTQALWLSQAYRVDIVYVVGHSWVLAGIADGYGVQRKRIQY
ncbi:PIG-M-domain-containing protein [Lactifluus volemus]|nr:PIG-M-domain-containing protein [Lactifluus volemus]